MIIGQQPSIDVYSPTWDTVKRWVEAEILKAREKNDSLKLDHDRTTALRSRIKTLQEFLMLPETISQRKM